MREPHILSSSNPASLQGGVLAGPGGQTGQDLSVGPPIERLFHLRADDDVYGLPELVGHLDHVHEAGIHAEEVDLPSQERADPGKENVYFR
ncbi:MAG: hypothetical protein A2V65_10895 [Deltaproteobacteria bacterium RBG_13_49_15]|nr:MAG: hypothetical protein A2V65_10895 [Deltaproteobacteria bacterium RBG_13_49_15]